MKTLRGFLLLLLLAGAALVGIRLLQSGPKLPTLPLPDGAELVIRHVSFTNLHAWNPRGPVASFLSRWIPRRLDGLLGLPNPGSTVSTSDPSVGIWWTVRDPETGSWVDPSDQFEMELVDQDGCVFPASGRNSSQSWTSGGHSFRVALNQFSNLPRGESPLTARIVDRKGGELGRITLPNPAPPTAAPDWPVEDLPAIRSTNNLSVTLKEIAVGPREITPWDRARFDFTPRFDLAWNGQPAPDWLLDGFFFRDASGNVGHRLCPREPAWRVVARFIKSPTATFETNQLWDVGVLSIPAAGEMQSLNLEHRFDPAVLQIFGISGPGRYQWSNDVCVVSRPVDTYAGMSIGGSTRNNDRFTDVTVPHPHLLLRTTGLPHTRRLSARATTDRGQVIGRKFPHQSNGISLFDFDVPPGTRTIRVELIAQDPLGVEFTVRPPVTPAARPDRSSSDHLDLPVARQ